MTRIDGAKAALGYPSFGEAKATADRLWRDTTVAGLALQAFPKLADGRTPDDVKVTPGFRAARSAYESAHQALRAFNEHYTVAFAAELRAERRARLKALAAATPSGAIPTCAGTAHAPPNAPT